MNPTSPQLPGITDVSPNQRPITGDHGPQFTLSFDPTSTPATGEPPRSLPPAPPANTLPQHPGHETPRDDSARVHVLLIDDDPDFHRVVETYMRAIPDQRYRLECEADYEHGLGALLSGRYDVCIVDYRLGSSDGVSLIGDAVGRGCDVPLVMLTGLDSKEIDIAAMEAGASDFLPKWQLDEVHLERILRQSRVREHRTRELKESRRFLQATLDSLLPGIAILDERGQIVQVNASWRQVSDDNLFQGERHDTGTDYFEALAEIARQGHEAGREIADGIRRVMAGASASFSTEYTLGIGDAQRFFIVRVTPFQDEAPTRVVVAHTDISDRKRMELAQNTLLENLHHTQKLESLGVMAGGIAHDFNNLLMAIMANADLAAMDLEEESAPLEAVEQIRLAARRAAELTSQMLAYSGKSTLLMRSMSLSELADSMRKLLGASVGGGIEINYALQDGLPPVQLDKGQLEQVLVNLVTNAAEAMGGPRGTITVRTGLSQFDRDYLAETWLDEKLPAGYYAWVEVADTGTGMDDEVKERLFDPFFTTKFTGRGLGLAAVLGIVRAHKGGVKVTSEVDKGSVVRVLLPALDVSPEAITRCLAQTPEPALRRRLALVVDDEEGVRHGTARLLKRLGYEVLTAAHGGEGVDVFRAHAEDIDIVLLDATMPVMSGEEVMRELRRIRSDARVILASGYDQARAVFSFEEAAFAGFLQKPFGLRELRESLELAEV